MESKEICHMGVLNKHKMIEKLHERRNKKEMVKLLFYPEEVR